MSCCAKIFGSFRNVIINWPPLIIFVGTLALLSGVTLVLGIYVYNAEDITDIDALTWNKFLLRLNEARFCPTAATLDSASVHGNHSRVTSVLLHAGYGHELVANGTALTLETRRQDGLNITVEVQRRSVAAAPLVCVRITQPSDTTSSSTTAGGSAGAGPLPSPDLGIPPGCDAKAAARGTFDIEPDTSWRRCRQDGSRLLRLTYRADDEWDITINAVDQQRIYTHLSVTSMFLLVTAVCMFLVTAIRNRPRYTLTAGDKVSITDG